MCLQKHAGTAAGARYPHQDAKVWQQHLLYYLAPRGKVPR